MATLQAVSGNVDEKVEAITTICDERECLKKIQESLAARPLAARTHLAQLQKEERILMLQSAPATSPKEKALLTSLAAIAGSRAAVLSNKINTELRPLEQTIEKINTRIGNLGTLLKLWPGDQSAFSGSAAVGHAGDKVFTSATGGCKADAEPSPSNPSTGCQVTQASADKLKQAAGDLQKITKIKALATSDIKIPTLEVEVEYKGTPVGTDNQGNGNTHCGDHATPRGGSLTKGVAFVRLKPKTAAPKPTETKLASAKTPTAGGEPADPYIETATAIAQAAIRENRSSKTLRSTRWRRQQLYKKYYC
ncbi:uncharacterized protein TEOVI_000409600 [Trypanosoma equiperdum]|uniref:Variant surface glycoprotein 1125 n=1 Tax=Trypanosoma equiperdum TaxID=5694 RepID=A0A1G4IJI9_TRYEQ|nr:hypothetical protein TEOVI_000409600 [Trypanosoma equiperdum]